MTYAPRSTPPLELANRETLVADQVGARFTDRLAAHLADVQYADKAHRVIRSEEAQKIEALIRVAAESHARIDELERRLSDDLADRVADLAASRPEEISRGRVTALIDILAGNDEDAEESVA